MKIDSKVLIQLIIASLLFTSSVYANGKKGHAHEWVAPRQEIKRANPVEKTPGSIDRGASLFNSYCTACHGVDAKGEGPLAKGMKPAPSDLSVMAGRHTDGDLAWKIATGKGPMPGWQNILSKLQIWDVVNFIKSLARRSHTEHKTP